MNADKMMGGVRADCGIPSKRPQIEYTARCIELTPNQTAKADAGKARLSLVPFQIVYDIAHVRSFGVSKYKDPDNWKKVEPQRYVDALLRHILAFAEDNQSIDTESGLPHLWHAACNLAFLCEMLKEEYNGMDKR